MTTAIENCPENIATSLCGLRLDSPIILPSGCVGFGEEYTRVEGFSNRQVGGIVLKGTTLEPRPGNAPHRVYETPMGMLNAIGLQNPGAHKVINEILPSLDFSETRFIANVCGSVIESMWLVCPARLNKKSCPRTSRASFACSRLQVASHFNYNCA